MKKSLLSVLTIALFLAFGLSSCSDYEEGGMSIKSKKSRLENVWVLEKSMVDNVDQTLSEWEKKDTYEFTKDGKITFTFFDEDGTSESITGTWLFIEDDTQLEIKQSYTIMGQTFTNTDTVGILKLKSKELWIKSANSSPVYEQHMIPKE